MYAWKRLAELVMIFSEYNFYKSRRILICMQKLIEETAQ